MRSGEVTLSHGEIDRLAVVQALEGGRLKQADAAWQLGLSIRQVKRLLQKTGTDLNGANLSVTD